MRNARWELSERDDIRPAVRSGLKSVTFFALLGKNGWILAFLGLLGEFCLGLAVGGVLLGEFCLGLVVGGGLLGEFFRGLAKRGLLLGELFRSRGRRGVAGRVLYRLAPEKGCVSLDTTLQQRLQRLATAPAVAPLAQPPAPRAATAPAAGSGN